MIASDYKLNSLPLIYIDDNCSQNEIAVLEMPCFKFKAIVFGEVRHEKHPSPLWIFPLFPRNGK